MKENIKTVFSKRFGDGGAMYASAGRINLIGEHTDYNGGFVFPGAIDKCIAAQIKKNGTDKCKHITFCNGTKTSVVNTKEIKPRKTN